MDSSQLHTRPKPEETLAVAYVRVSSDEQAKDSRTSLQDQHQAVSELAGRVGCQIGRSFADPGVSGATAEDRPGFMAMLAYCQANERPRSEPGYVLVLNDSRWGRFRNPDEAGYWRVAFEKLGWRVRFAEGDDTEDPLARGVLRTIHSAQASAYREAIRANAKRGARGTAAQGYWQNEAPIGYLRQAYKDGRPTRILRRGERKASDEKVRLTAGPPEEQELVRWLFERYAAGTVSLGQLARDAQERYPERNWVKQTVRAVLTNRVYLGEVIWGRRPHDALEREETPVRDPVDWVVAEDAHPALITPEVLHRVQEILKRNKRQTRATKGGYPLSGLLKCSQCGKSYVGGGGPKGPPDDRDRYRFYRDSGGVAPRGVCPGPLGTLQKRVVEPQVIRAICEVVSQPAVREVIEKQMDLALQDLEGTSETRQSGVRKQLRTLRERRQRIVGAIGRGVIGEVEASEELSVLREDETRLQSELDRLRFWDRRGEGLAQERGRLLKLAKDFPALAKRLTGAHLRELIRPWLQDAVVDKYKRTLTLTIRRAPNTGPFLLASTPPGRDGRKERFRLTERRIIRLSPPGGRARGRATAKSGQRIS
jgi:DNA invertase Pin-like site-specific DNA recombinase